MKYSLNDKLILIARVLLALLFLQAGLGKVAYYESTQIYMISMGIPGWLLPLAILLELGGGLAVIVGALTKFIAPVFIFFCMATALVFHTDFNNAAESINFMKNMSIAGGFLFLFITGPGAYSLDRRFKELKSKHDHHSKATALKMS